MRAAIDIHSLAGPPQGISTYTRHLAEEAAAQAPDIEFVLLNSPGARPALREAPNLRQVDWVGGVAARVGFGARRQTRQLGCSAYHTSYWLPMAMPRNPLVTIHDVLPDTHPQFFSLRFRVAAQRWFRYSARHSRHVFTVSAYARDTLIDLYRIAPDRISVTPCAVDLAHFAQGAHSDPSAIDTRLRRQGYFLIVGRFDPRKDHATALRAYGALAARHPDLPLLVIAGSHGPMEALIRARIAQPDLAGRVLLLKNVSYAHLPVLYAHALATLSPSVGEGFGLPSLEAMAAGSPVICADNTAQNELVNGHGLMFSTGNADQLADAMLRVASDPALQSDLRARGLARAPDYSWRTGAQALVQVLRQLDSR